MKTKQIFFTLSCLLLLVITGQSDVARAYDLRDRDRHKNNLRAHWDDGRASMSTTASLFWNSPEFRAALGVSDEDYQAILARQYAGTPRANPEYREAMREYEDARRVALGLEDRDPMPTTSMLINLRWLNEEQLKAFHRSQEIERRMESMRQEFAAQPPQPRLSDEEAITPELW